MGRLGIRDLEFGIRDANTGDELLEKAAEAKRASLTLAH